jgi:hypothetical protein
MIAASTTVNFIEQLNTHFSSDTLHQNFLLYIFALQDTVDQYVLLTMAHEPLVLCSISIPGPILQKLDKRLSPIFSVSGRRYCRCGQKGFCNAQRGNRSHQKLVWRLLNHLICFFLDRRFNKVLDEHAMWDLSSG